MLRWAFAMTLALSLFGCAEPTFPTNTPPETALYSTGAERKPEPPPVPKGVAQFQMDPETKPRIAMIVAISFIAFIVALLISLAMRAVDRLIPAGIAAAFLGPIVALLIAARRMAHILTGFAEGPFFFADFALAMWNDNQPLLIGLYSGSIILVIVLVIAAVTKSDSERGLATFMTSLCAIVGAIVSFVSFISMNRLVMAMLDPIRTDSLPRTLRSMSFGGAARLLQVLMITTLSAAAISVVLLLLTLVFAFVMRRIRGRMLITLVALIVMLCAAAVDRTWSDVLEASARTGHVPDTILTR
jgi:hypothetical protein